MNKNLENSRMFNFILPWSFTTLFFEGRSINSKTFNNIHFHSLAKINGNKNLIFWKVLLIF